MDKVRRIWALLSDKETALIEEAAQKDRRSRASFMAMASLERAAQILGSKTGD